MIFKGKPGIYDLVFRGAEGSAGRSLPAGRDTLGVATSPARDVAGVLERAAGEKPLALTVYGSDGGAIRTLRLGRLFADGFLSHRIWVGSGGQALIVGERTNVGELLRDKPGEQPPEVQVKAWWCPAGAEPVELSGLPVIEEGLVDMREGFVLSRYGTPDERVLCRYSGAGRLLWTRTFAFHAGLRPSKMERCDFFVGGGDWRVHFYRHGSHLIERIPFDPEAFRRANPDYVERTTALYEKERLPEAVRQLAEAVGADRAESTGFREALAGFIREYLAVYASRGPYEGVGAELPGQIMRLDERMAAILQGRRFDVYRRWRETEKGNALHFMFSYRQWAPEQSLGPVTLPDRTAEGPVKLALEADLQSVVVSNIGDREITVYKNQLGLVIDGPCRMLPPLPGPPARIEPPVRVLLKAGERISWQLELKGPRLSLMGATYEMGGPENRVKVRYLDLELGRFESNTVTHKVGPDGAAFFALPPGKLRWGAEVGGLRLGIACDRQRVPVDGGLELVFQFSAPKDRDVLLWGGNVAKGWRATLTPLNGGETLRAVWAGEQAGKAPDMVVSSGAPNEYRLDVHGEGWVFETAAQDGKAPRRLKTPPPGRYRVSLSFSDSRCGNGLYYWHGEVVSGSLELELEAR
ncbi:MAG TPA: hypothetical protein PK280_08300 [Planctomycetota bacterium]|nr:hypothetical protein [Planctomycetota bacterium]